MHIQEITYQHQGDVNERQICIQSPGPYSISDWQNQTELIFSSELSLGSQHSSVSALLHLYGDWLASPQ